MERKPCTKHFVHTDLFSLHYDPWRWGLVYTHLKEEDAKAQGGRIPDSLLLCDLEQDS